MSRRRIVVLASAATLLGLFTLVVLALGTLTSTGWGREKIRAFAEARLNKVIKGKLYLGRIRGSLLGGVVVDSVELRDQSDSLFLAAGRVSASFDVRDLLDMRIALRDVTLDRATLHIDIDSANTVNFRKIFPPGPPGPPRITRAWGDFIALRNTEIRNLTLQVRLPWHPDSSARGVRRDSLIAYALSRTDKEIRRVPWGYQQTWRWTEGSLSLDSARLDDRGPRGRTLNIRNLDINGFDPPFNFRNMRGTARMQADSLFVDFPHFDLPASTGSGKGKVWWGGPNPIRYDLTIVGDSVSLADINWVYPTLPKTGGGKLNLAIRNESDLRLIDYVLTDMDVRSMDSWLRGRMTFGIGAPITILKDVDLVAQPVDFRLIEQISGAPLPYPFRGTLSGTLKARGGPLNKFVVDASDIIYRDANVPGATTIGQGDGELDVLKPSNTAFHSFNLQLDQLDLRTVQFLNPSFPRLDGIIAGRATLDSTLLDMRFRNADLTHSNGSGPVTRATGAGRVTFGEATTYDVALTAQPISFTTLAHSYKGGRIPLRGEYQGPVRLQGTLQDLVVSTELRGPSGIVVYDGRVDADSVGGYGAHGALQFGSLDLRTFLDTAITPTTQLTGHVDLDVAGDSLATLTGSATLELERSFVDSVRVYPSRARLRFADRRLLVDTLDVQTVIATVSARGALGLAADTRDSLAFTVDADSLGGMRRYLVRNEGDSGDQAPIDSLLATAHGVGRLYGSLDSLRAHVAVDARGVDAMTLKARAIRFSGDFDDVTNGPKGKTSVTADTLTVGGLRLQSFGADLTMTDSTSGEFSVLTTAFEGPVLESAGRLELLGDTTIAHLRTFAIAVRDHRLTLQREGTVRVEPHRVALDSLQLDGEKGEEIFIAADLPSDGPIRGIFRTDSVHLADFADLSQKKIALGGLLTGQIDLKGTRSSPEITLAGKIVEGNVGQVKIATIEMNGHYLDRRVRGGLQVYQRDTAVMAVSANIPIDLSLASRTRRMLNDTLRVTVRSRDVDLALLQSFTSSIRNSSGRFNAQLDLAGPESNAVIVGTVAITDASASLPTLGIVLRQFNANIEAARDTVAFKRFSVLSGDQNDSRLTLEGLIARPLHDDRSFDLTFTARNFRAIGSKKLAELVVSTSPPLRLVGSWKGASTLTGAVVVNRGVIYMPPSSDKQLITLEPDDLAGLDTAAVARLQLLPKPPPDIVRNLVVDNVTLQMGPDVWLRSAESREMNVKLGGALSVTTGGRARDGTPQLALNGELRTERGTYLLNLASVVARTFSIENGNLRFYDDPELNPALDISAVYVAPQVSVTYGGRNDVRIRVRIRGTLSQPTLSLESADSLALSASDLISYLLVGAPSFDIAGGRNSYTSQLSSVALTSFANLGASRLVGRFIDYVQVQTAAEKFQIANLTQSSLLTGAALGLGKQLNDKTFLALNAGVCQFFKGSSQLDPITLAQNIGVKLEYQIRPQLGIAASSEPSLSALFCGQARGFTTSVRQYGFDLFRTFRW